MAARLRIARLLARLLACATALLAPVLTQAEPAHEHGALTLALAVEGAGFTLDLESPLDNLIGFEHAPRSDAQRQAVRTLAQRLRSGALFVANTEAGCSVRTVSLASAALPAALLGERTQAPPEAGHEGHADLDASLSYVCQHPQALRTLTVKLADAVPGIRRITVQLATPRGQSQQVLSGTQRQLRW
jgi:hypothetical protein